jgi:signal transduction histidine kinase
MLHDGRRNGPLRNRTPEGSDVPLEEDESSALVGIGARRSGRYARLEMASHSTTGFLARAPARNELLIDVGLAVAVFAGSLGLLAAGGPEGDGGDVDAASVLLVALASLPLVAWRRAPLSVFVLTAVASSVLRFVSEPAGPPLGPTIALYLVALANDGSRTRTRLILAVAAVMLVAHLAATGLSQDAFPGVETLFGVLTWGGAWLAADRTRLRRERMVELEERAVRAEREAERERLLAAAEERGRIARDLHDSAGHAINVILVHAGLGRMKTEDDPESARQAFETIEQVARETVGEIDQMVSALREDASLPAGAGDVEPPPGLAALEGLVQRHRVAGLRVTTTTHGERRPLPPSVDRAVYRILQEALTNAARHGDGSAAVELTFAPDALEVSVANGIRPDQAGRAASGGHGVIGMRERAALLGGSVEVSIGDRRFTLRARLPCADGRG